MGVAYRILFLHSFCLDGYLAVDADWMEDILESLWPGNYTSVKSKSYMIHKGWVASFSLPWEDLYGL